MLLKLFRWPGDPVTSLDVRMLASSALADTFLCHRVSCGAIDSMLFDMCRCNYFDKSSIFDIICGL